MELGWKQREWEKGREPRGRGAGPVLSVPLVWRKKMAEIQRETEAPVYLRNASRETNS